MQKQRVEDNSEAIRLPKEEKRVRFDFILICWSTLIVTPAEEGSVTVKNNMNQSLVVQTNDFQAW